MGSQYYRRGYRDGIEGRPMRPERSFYGPGSFAEYTQGYHNGRTDSGRA